MLPLVSSHKSSLVRRYFVNLGNYTTTSALIRDKDGHLVLASATDGVQIVEPPVLRDRDGNPLTQATVYGNSNTYDLYRQIWGTKRANLSTATWANGQPTYSPGHGTPWYIHGHDSFARGSGTLGCVGTPEERVLNWLTTQQPEKRLTTRMFRYRLVSSTNMSVEVSKMWALRTLGALLVSALLSMSNSCSMRRSEGKNNVVAETAPTQSTSSPIMQTPEREEHDAISVMRFPNEPIALLRADIGKGANDSQITLEIQNASDKTVRLVTYGLGVSTLCSEFMYAMVPSPHIGYGDWRLANVRLKPVREEPPLKPQQRVAITVEKDEDLAKLLNPKTYQSCPEGHKKPELMLQNVYFDDGSEWRPNSPQTAK